MLVCVHMLVYVRVFQHVLWLVREMASTGACAITTIAQYNNMAMEYNP